MESHTGLQFKTRSMKTSQLPAGWSAVAPVGVATSRKVWGFASGHEQISCFSETSKSSFGPHSVFQCVPGFPSSGLKWVLMVTFHLRIVNSPVRSRLGIQEQFYSFFNLGARQGWVVNVTPGHFTPRIDTVPIVQEAGWATGSGLDGCAEPGCHRDSIHGHSTPQRVALPTELSLLTNYMWCRG